MSKKNNKANKKFIISIVFTLVVWIVLFISILSSETKYSMFFDLLTVALVFPFGVWFIWELKSNIKQEEESTGLGRKLKNLDQQKNEFISMAAHELRAPMTAIKGYISMVTQGDAGQISEKARGFLADANTINDRLIRLVNNMLNVSRIEEGRLVFQLETEELSHVIRAVYSQFIPEAERKGLDYSLKIPKHIRDKVEVDPDRIYEVIANLISNAIKYTDEGSVVVRLLQPDKGIVRFEVEDTGPGISKQEQEKLFQKFYRVETNVGKTTGTGLGLYISRLLMEKFNGKIGLISEFKKGSTFWFEIPIVTSSPKEK
jgi:signal transduction histidine kinase